MWKKLLISRNIFTNFCKCTIGNGSALTFLQNWSGLGPMIDYIPEHLRDSYDHKCISIADAITMGETFIHSLCNIISQDILVAFTKNITPIHQTAAFAYIWLLDQHGNFSIKSAYSVLYQLQCNRPIQNATQRTDSLHLDRIWHQLIPLLLLPTFRGWVSHWFQPAHVVTLPKLKTTFMSSSTAQSLQLYGNILSRFLIFILLKLLCKLI